MTSQETKAPVVSYCGEEYFLDSQRPFVVGREADLSIDENPYLHRQFLTITARDGIWWIENIGNRIAATIAEDSHVMQAWLGPGARLPLVFERVSVVFTAGPTTYEFEIRLPSAEFSNVGVRHDSKGQTTVGAISFTQSQFLMILALAEPWLRRVGTGSVDIPSSSQAARRLGWPLTTFNRKLDNVADKLDRIGVKGLRGGPDARATKRRARLVEYAVTSQIVRSEDIYLLDEESARNAVQPGAPTERGSGTQSGRGGSGTQSGRGGVSGSRGVRVLAGAPTEVLPSLGDA